MALQIFICVSSKIVILLTAILKTTRSFVVLVFRVDDNKVVSGGGTKTESGGSIGGLDVSRKKLTKSKSQIKSKLNCTEYTEDKKGVYPS